MRCVPIGDAQSLDGEPRIAVAELVPEGAVVAPAHHFGGKRRPRGVVDNHRHNGRPGRDPAVRVVVDRAAEIDAQSVGRHPVGREELEGGLLCGGQQHLSAPQRKDARASIRPQFIEYVRSLARRVVTIDAVARQRQPTGERAKH